MTTSAYLVTGGAGRIGDDLVRGLADIGDVWEVVHRSPSRMPRSVKIDGDLGDAQAAIDVTSRFCEVATAESVTHIGIVHMATRGLSGSSLEQELALAVVAADHMIETVLALKRARQSFSFVFTSSLAVETLPSNGLAYVVGKACGETLIGFRARQADPSCGFCSVRIDRLRADPKLVAATAGLVRKLASDHVAASRGGLIRATPEYLRSMR